MLMMNDELDCSCKIKSILISYQRLQRTAMFFNRYYRMKTEPRIPGRQEDNLRDNKRKLKIKNIRFSLDHEPNKGNPPVEEPKEDEPREQEKEQEPLVNRKRIMFLQKLPEISYEGKQGQKEVSVQKKNFSFQQHKKKDALLNSILQILKPTNQNDSELQLCHKADNELKKERQIRIEPSSKEYINEFIQEVPNQSSTKHHRTPKIIQNDIFKFRNSNNIVRRKIYSEEKERSKMEREKTEHRKQNPDLEKIEILTFANKFPIFKKEPDKYQ